MRLPLIDGHGNFGSLDDGPAAMRYTECRMATAAAAMTDGLDEDTVDFKPNYDGKDVEPTVLPAAFPNLLVNGATGIAVGMATNCPPHNLVEVVQALRHLIKHPDADIDELMRFVPGPDLPSGGKIIGLDGIRDAYHTGKGSFRMRATARIEQVHPRRKGIVITELPYLIGPERVIEQIKNLVNARKLQGIADVKDLSDRANGTRLVIEIKSGFNPDAILEQLYKLTKIEDNYAINAVALVDGQPRTLTLRDLLTVYLGASLRGHPAAHRLRPPNSSGTPAPRRGPAGRDPRHRRRDRDHPYLRRHRPSPRPADGGVRAVRDPDQLHPRDAAAPAHPIQPDRARDRAGQAGERPSPSSPRSWRIPSSSAPSSATSSPRSLSSTARRAAPSCWPPAALPRRQQRAPLEVADDPCWVLLSSAGPACPHRHAQPLPPVGRPGQPRRHGVQDHCHGTRRLRPDHQRRPVDQDQRAGSPDRADHRARAEPPGRHPCQRAGHLGRRREGALSDHAGR